MPSVAEDPPIQELEQPPSSGDRSSSALCFHSFAPDGLRDTAVTRTTELDAGPSSRTVRNRPLLLRMDGTEAGEVHSLDKDSVQLGRHTATDIALTDTGVSRVHARVFVESGQHHIEDLGSRNGTFVEDQRVEHAPLTDGQTIRLGPRVSFRYAILDKKQEDLLRQLYESSKRDGLTGIFNRKHFEERLAAELSYAIRHEVPLGLVLFDLDYFKHVNDTYGHPAGDAVLRHVTAVVTQKLRNEDLFARVGGEEFAVLLRGANLRSAARVGERLRVAVATAPVHFDGNQIPVSVSVGCVTTAEEPEPTAQSLVDRVDARLYRAKRCGRNRVVSSDED